MDGNKFLAGRHIGAPIAPEVARHEEMEVLQNSKTDKSPEHLDQYGGYFRAPWQHAQQQQQQQPAFYQQAPEEAAYYQQEQVQTYPSPQSKPQQMGYFPSNGYQTQSSQVTLRPQTQPQSQPQMQQQFLPKSHSYSTEHRYPSETKREIGRNGWIVIVVLVLLVVAAAVGGGVGGSIAVANAKVSAAQAASNTNTNSSTTTPNSSTTPGGANAWAFTGTIPNDLTVAGANVVANLDCPGLSGTVMRVDPWGNRYDFALECGGDYTMGRAIDILAATTLTLRDCLRTCATYNINMGSDACVAATYQSEVSQYTKDHGGNCFLKNATMGHYTQNSDKIIVGTLVA